MRALRNLDPAVLAAAAAVGSGSGTCPAGDPDADADALQQRAPSQDTGHDVAAAPSGRRARTSGAMSTAAACVEVVDLASEDDGDEDDAGGRKAADVASCAAAASTSQAVKRPSFGSEAGAAAASADVAAGAQSLLALLKDLGLIGEEGEGTETVGGDGGEGSGRSAGAAPPADGSAASERVAAAGLGLRVTPRDLRLLAEAGSGPVLVVARELHSAKLLERVVREGGRAVMQHQYESYLLNKLQCGEGPRRGGVGGGGAGRGGSGRGGGGGGWKRYRGGIVDGEEGGRGPVLRPGEHQALLAAAHLVGVERGELTAGTGAQGRGAKRAKTSHHREAAAAENDGAGGGARGGRGGRRGGGSGGSQRRRKPDDSPVRVAAAAAAEEKEEEVEEEEEEEEEQDAAGGGPGAFRRVAGRVEGVSGVGGGSGGSRSGSGAIGKHGDGDSGPGDSEDDWVEGAPVRSRQPPSRQQQRRGRGVAGRGRAGKAQQRGQQQRSHGRSRGGDVSSGEAAATGSPTIPGDSGGGTDTLGGRGGGAGSGGPADGANGPSVAPLHSPPPSLLRDVHFVSLDGHDEFVLWRLKPSFVIMYEPDLAFLRQLEVYQAERCLGGGCPVWLHTLSYAQSLEQQRFRAAVERERETLLRLIQAKQHLVLPTQAAPGSSGANGSRVG
ncbi:hypothetical protein Vretifemale_19875 [Volvox reticuliferus]|uniref:Uncharacterized protein n=3 Tax=Volvox reticuliferus TaxID=1737510 RepID=A0A8J4D4B0_9CHLO|nr:hypothetical protein Vretifemale_19875 [Volvox reticuliferus]